MLRASKQVLRPGSRKTELSVNPHADQIKGGQHSLLKMHS
jgi:hypothetical protein